MTRLQRAAARVGDGSASLAWRIASWPAAGEGWRACCARTVWLGFCGWSGWRVVDHQQAVAALLAAGWLGAAWRAGGEAPGDAEEQLDDEPEDEPEPEQPRQDPAEVRAYLLGITRALIADAKGVHLDVLLAALVQRGALPAGHRITALRRELEAHGIPVRDSVRVGGAVRVGIHRDDLPAPSEAPPPAPAEAA